jgi:hypothetical protein
MHFNCGMLAFHITQDKQFQPPGCDKPKALTPSWNQPVPMSAADLRGKALVLH